MGTACPAPGNFTWLDDIRKYVMTTFYPFQWDLNYWNPVVLNEMIYNMLYLANRGIDVIRIDAVPYIWKQLGTNCRNLPQVHNIVRIMRMISEIVCPGILLLGEVVMEPSRVVPYFGSVRKPECHLLYNVTTMATTWNTVNSILGFVRKLGQEKLIALFNFSDCDKTAWIQEDGSYTDVMSGETMRAEHVKISGGGFRWLYKQ